MDITNKQQITTYLAVEDCSVRFPALLLCLAQTYHLLRLLSYISNEVYFLSLDYHSWFSHVQTFLARRSRIFIFENFDSPILESSQNYFMYHIYNITKLRIPHKSFLILSVTSHYSIHPLRLILLHQTGPRYFQLYLAYLESQDTVTSHRYFQLFLAYLESQDLLASGVTIHIYFWPN